MIVHLPAALDDYTGGQRTCELEARTLEELFALLDERYPGIAFRLLDEVGAVRRHIRVWRDGVPEEDLGAPLRSDAVVHVTLALSGG